MKFVKENIKFTQSQKIGILLLLGIIFMLQVVILNFDSFFYKEAEPNYKVPISLQKQYDSLKKIALEKRKQKIYPFNPNYITEYRAYFLGIDLKSLDRIESFRKKGKYFQTKEEFKRVSGISDSLFDRLAPYIQIPDFKKYQSYTIKKQNIKQKNINVTTAEELELVSGIGPVLSKRIVKYRNSIGGFSNKQQLKNVYGLDNEVIDRVWKIFYLQKKDLKTIEKKGINMATAEDLKMVNGIGEKLAERIISLRTKNGGFAIKEELNTIYGLKPEVIQRIWDSFSLVNPKKIEEKISLNDSNIKELAVHPYISYSLAKKIVSYRTLHGGFKSFDELKKVPSFPTQNLKIIALYLKLD